MSAQLVYDQAHVKIFLREDVPAVLLQWHGFATSKEFRSACEKSLEALTGNNLSKMIADNREGKAIAPDDQKWLSEDWFPRAIAAGLRRSAVILSESALNQHASNRISNDVNGDLFQARNFTQFEDALVWLENDEL